MLPGLTQEWDSQDGGGGSADEAFWDEINLWRGHADALAAALRGQLGEPVPGSEHDCSACSALRAYDEAKAAPDAGSNSEGGM